MEDAPNRLSPVLSPRSRKCATFSYDGLDVHLVLRFTAPDKEEKNEIED
jgi:hypothetical protein